MNNISFNKIQNSLDVLHQGNHNSGGNPHKQYRLIKPENKNCKIEVINKYIKILDIYTKGIDNYNYGIVNFSLYNVSGPTFANFIFKVNMLNNSIILSKDSVQNKYLSIDNLFFIMESSGDALSKKIGVYLKITSAGSYNIILNENVSKDIQCVPKKIDYNNIIESLPESIESLNVSVETPYNIFNLPKYETGFSATVNEEKLIGYKYTDGSNKVIINGTFEVLDITKNFVCYYEAKYEPVRVAPIEFPVVLTDRTTSKKYIGVITLQIGSGNHKIILTPNLPDGYSIGERGLFCRVNLEYIGK